MASKTHSFKNAMRVPYMLAELSLVEAYSNQTELSKHVWQLKKAKVYYTITWKILDRAQSYSNATKRCKLCTPEKFYVYVNNVPSQLSQ